MSKIKEKMARPGSRGSPNTVESLRLIIQSVGGEEYAQAVSRLSEQTGLPSHQPGLQADMPGLSLALH
jgi:hypothetical protein